MLRGIVFDLAPDVMKFQAVQELLQALNYAGIDFAVSSAISLSFGIGMRSHSSDSWATGPLLTLPPEYCLFLADSATGIASAHAAGIPCIGYAPQGSTGDMSGAYALFEDFASIDVAYLCRTHAHMLGYPAEILTTERLMVREFSKEDFPTLYAMCTEPSTASCMEEPLSDYETEQEKHRAYLQNVYPLFDLALWGVFERTTGRLIGRAGFSLSEDTSGAFSVGYLIDVPYRRCGYAKELIPALLSYAKEQGYTKISARIKTENVASVKALEQCGYPFDRTEDTIKGILMYLIHMQE